MKPQISRQVALPQEFPFIQIIADTSTKASMCGICMSQIPKKQPRVYLLYKRPWRKYPEKVFMHADCFRQFADGQPGGFECCDCQTVCDLKTMTKLCIVSGNSWQYQNVCWQCSMKKQYRLCECCGCLFPRFHVSQVMGVSSTWGWEGNIGKLMCNACAITERCDTINTMRIAAKENSFIDEQYLKILTDIGDGNFFGEEDV